MRPTKERTLSVAANEPLGDPSWRKTTETFYFCVNQLLFLYHALPGG